MENLSLRTTEEANEVETFKTFQLSLCDHGGLAQLARAPALQAGGQRFESVILHRGFCKDCTNEVSDNPTNSTRVGQKTNDL